MKISNKRTKNFAKSKRYLSLIKNSSVYDVANVSPTTYAINISNKLGHNVFLKREDLQPIFSFKNRGAYNKIVNIKEDKLKLGVIAASAGNLSLIHISEPTRP